MKLFALRPHKTHSCSREGATEVMENCPVCLTPGAPLFCFCSCSLFISIRAGVQRKEGWITNCWEARTGGLPTSRKCLLWVTTAPSHFPSGTSLKCTQQVTRESLISHFLTGCPAVTAKCFSVLITDWILGSDSTGHLDSLPEWHTTKFRKTWDQGDPESGLCGSVDTFANTSFLFIGRRKGDDNNAGCGVLSLISLLLTPELPENPLPHWCIDSTIFILFIICVHTADPEIILAIQKSPILLSWSPWGVPISFNKSFTPVSKSRFLFLALKVSSEDQISMDFLIPQTTVKEEKLDSENTVSNSESTWFLLSPLFPWD